MEPLRDFRVCVRRTEASDRCRLKGDGVLRADVDALHLIDKTGDIVLTWPYRYLRRFGRDKTSFSFEAGRRCDSGEGSFEFDTKQGNFLFQAVEAAINLQRVPAPHRQTSGGGQPGPDTPHDQNQNRMPPLPQPRINIPQSTAAQGADGVYSMTRLEPPVDKALTGVKSLTLDTRGVPVPRKNQVKMISSCPLPQPAPDPGPNLRPTRTQSDVLPDHHAALKAKHQEGEEERRVAAVVAVAAAWLHPLVAHEPEYSLPFDTIAMTS
ncbi:Docking protein 2 Downstream of tyrosine kinase 2 p56(dok-2) [Larimichthys crocea]|uniref:Docking protein 2 Downstream of tyrosine kinase 2 p56(Dok-2) n=1 Tax=Larimichthys crocea TaxID=215358 RepID=A0A6G0HE28_LARCR|nr:Docking protein 2 Downstream of tyrosine kinase 2 p56(dok-2) [Larimichthys crocea]